jgi:hypothetical protein
MIMPPDLSSAITPAGRSELMVALKKKEKHNNATSEDVCNKNV